MDCYLLIFILIIFTILLLFLGAVGYHHIFGTDAVDSFYGAALTMSGLSQEIPPKTAQEKLFVAVFALFSIGLYLVVIAAIIAVVLEPLISETLAQSRAEITPSSLVSIETSAK